MKRKNLIVILGIAIILGLTLLSGISTNYFKPVSTAAQQTQTSVFTIINEKARGNKRHPSFSKSEELVGLLIEGLSIFEIPVELQTPIKEQVANAHLNGLSGISENNIAISINNLASQASAPNYAYTNAEQVKVVRKFLNRLIPDVVSSNGEMTDLEAFAVFITTLSQKSDNDAFMVTPAEFTASMETSGNHPFPGSSAASAPVAPEVNQESAKAAEMLEVVNNYVSSENRMSSNNIVTMIGIQ